MSLPLHRRYLERQISEDLAEKMVFVSGPRQMGKTTLACRLAMSYPRSAAFNWDSTPQKKSALRQQWRPDTEFLMFDEIHKYPRWRNFVKGVWDTRAEGQKILVTGSARLDQFRRGGDSLQGRYHHHVLHPFSLREMQDGPPCALPDVAEPPELHFESPGSREHL